MENNIVVASFSGSRSAVTVNRYQYDYGQKLHVIGIPGLPSVFEVHFASVPSSGEAKIWVGQDGVVDIPDEYLATGTPVYAWIFLHTGEADGETVYSIKIPVVRRPRPVSDEPTPQQQSEIDTAIAALQAGVAKAEGFADDAEEQAGIAQNAANTATQAAEQAQGAVTSVEAAARRAEQSADAAGLSEGHARQYAVDSEDSAREAEAAKGAAETAQEKAETAQGKAKDAQEGAESAKDTAVEAKDDAVAAKGDAEQAKDDAVTAKNTAVSAKNDAVQAKDDSITAKNAAVQAQEKAEDAQEAAETAQGKAEEAQGKAEDAEATAEWYAERVERFLPTDTASGSIASFSDGADGAPMESVTVTMTPQQDLHGQDAPYPAGGGKNLIPFPYHSADGKYGGITFSTDNDGKITASGETTAGMNLFILNGGNLPAGTYTVSLKGRHIGVTLYVRNDATSTQIASISGGSSDASSTFTVENDITNLKIYFNQGTTGVTVDISAYLQLEKGTTATAYAPYSNICPITGYDSGTVWGTGKNLLEKSAVHFSTISRILSDCFFVKAGTYTFSVASMTGATSWRWGVMMKDAEGNNLSDSAYQPRSGFAWNNNEFWLAGANGTTTSVTFTFVVDCFIRSVFALGDTSASTVANDAMLNIGTTASPYTPYVGASYHSDFPSTVYGGTWGVTEGEIGDKMALMSGTVVSISPQSSDYANIDYGVVPKPTDSANRGNTGVHGLISNMYAVDPTVTGWDSADKIGKAFVGATYTHIWIGFPKGTTLAEMQSITADNIFCYTLAQPQSISVDPLTIPSQLGANNVWSDAGDIDVTYKADVGLYIDKRISEAVSALS